MQNLAAGVLLPLGITLLSNVTEELIAKTLVLLPLGITLLSNAAPEAVVRPSVLLPLGITLLSNLYSVQDA